MKTMPPFKQKEATEGEHEAARELQLTFDTDLLEFYPKDKIPRNILRLTSPFTWTSKRKNVILAICVITALFASVAPSAYSPGEEQMADEWHVSKEVTAVGVPALTWGFAVAPMALAPFSELRGRKPMFIAMGVVYVVCTLCCAVTQIYAGMIVARFFAGVGCSVFSTMIGGVIADMYRADERNTPMALFSGGAVLGIGLGPLLAGFIAQYTTWRWIFWMQVIINGTLVALFVFFVDESRDDIVLQRKADLLNKWENDRSSGHQAVRIRWTVGIEKPSLLSMMATSLTRPFYLLVREPVVFFFSLWAAFSWSVLYICLSVVPLVFQDVYGFSLSEANAIFAASCIGCLLATVLGVWQVLFATKRGWLPNRPESRLYFVCVEGWLLPIGLFLFGWTLYPYVHWVVPAIGIGLATAGIFFVYLAVFNYLADSYGSFASSAIAAQSFCRNAMGGVMPLFSQQMYKAMTYGGASSLLGGIAAILSLVPLVLVWKGREIRRRSKFACSVEGDQGNEGKDEGSE